MAAIEVHAHLGYAAALVGPVGPLDAPERVFCSADDQVMWSRGCRPAVFAFAPIRWLPAFGHGSWR